MGRGGHPQAGGHVGFTVTVGVTLGQHLPPHPAGTLTAFSSSSGQNTLHCNTGTGHLRTPPTTVTVGHAGAMMVVRLVVVRVVRGHALGRSGERVMSSWERAGAIRLERGFSEGVF